MKNLFALLCFASLAANAPAADIVPLPDKIACAAPDRQLAQVPDRVHLDGWVGGRIAVSEANRLVKVDTDRLLEGFRHRPGRQSYDGEHVGKWLHAATLAWANTGDPALRAKLDSVAAALVACQMPDGYLGTYVVKDRWTEWDVWAHKYDLIGLLTYARYTGNTAPLVACRRIGDLLCRTFGDQPGQRDIITAGEHVGMAPTSVLEPMVLLYRMTGEKRYLDFCHYIVRAWEQPNGPKIVSRLLAGKGVNEVGNGKAYEMLSCLNGALELYRTTGEDKLLQAAENAWQDVRLRRLYPTGTASYFEFFHPAHDFPPVNNVGETCVTVTWLQLNAQLLRLTGEARFADQIEKTVLNQLLGAQKCDGTEWGYYVQMEGKKPYSQTLDGNCCLSSGPRGIALIPTFALTTDGDGAVVNLYDAGQADLSLPGGGDVQIALDTRFPSHGDVMLKISTRRRKPFAIKLRLPEWSDDTKVRLNNGAPVDGKKSRDGYLAVTRRWRDGDVLRVAFSMKPRILVGDHQTANELAFCYGPLVLAADATLSNKTTPAFTIPAADPARFVLTPEPAPARLANWPGAQVFRLAYDGKTLPFEVIPFADAGQTGSEYKVWLPVAGRN